MTTASTLPVQADVTVAETTGRWPLTLLAGSAVVWLVLSGLLALAGSIQLSDPAFLAGCPLFTYGRTQAMAETAFIYGWIGNAGLALVLWSLGRFGGEPLRGANWAVAGASFWNLSVLLGLIGIAVGGGTAIRFLQMPGAIMPILLASYMAMAIPGVLAWTGRRRDLMFASQWYAVAALFLFPWLFSAAQVLLVWSPVRGVVQSVVAGWYAQSLWTLWMAPLGLGAAYFVIPKVTGKVLPAYDTALLGFWSLLAVGGLTGGRHLIGGPVPAWISTLAIVSSFVLLVHYIVVFLNLRPAWGGGGISLRFIGLGLFAYLLGGILDAVTSIRGVAERTQFTLVDLAQSQLGVYGGITLLLLGALYFAVPRMLGRPWASAGLVRGHWVLTLLGVVLLIVCLAGAGFNQAAGLADPKVSFSAIAEGMRPWLLGVVAANAVLLLASILLGLNFAATAASAAREEIKFS